MKGDGLRTGVSGVSSWGPQASSLQSRLLSALLQPLPPDGGFLTLACHRTGCCVGALPFQNVQQAFEECQRIGNHTERQDIAR